MANVYRFHAEPNFVTIPIEEAMYCSRCNAVNNSANDSCGGCGGETLSKVIAPTSDPPDGPDSGPAPAQPVIPTPAFEHLLRAA
ncbi:hypothetical protein [Acidicapsa dinghuensis]|uniref:hypothetical protein n=1 Tax=Acidicapsa dinghuensis TaxID=2218256 RepID=UPI0036708B72